MISTNRAGQPCDKRGHDGGEDLIRDPADDPGGVMP